MPEADWLISRLSTLQCWTRGCLFLHKWSVYCTQMREILIQNSLFIVKQIYRFTKVNKQNLPAWTAIEHRVRVYTLTFLWSRYLQLIAITILMVILWILRILRTRYICILLIHVITYLPIKVINVKTVQMLNSINIHTREN